MMTARTEIVRTLNGIFRSRNTAVGVEIIEGGGWRGQDAVKRKALFLDYFVSTIKRHHLTPTTLLINSRNTLF